VQADGTTSDDGANQAGRVVGMDAAGKYGWLAVLLDDGGFVGARLGSLRELVAWAEPVDVIGIDIPIGHTAEGVRQADVEARKFVGPKRASSVFAAPPKEILDAASYAEGNAKLQGLGRPMVSRQAWALLPKMLEAAELAGEDERVHEVHPEVSFCAMAGRTHLPWPKKSWNGLMHRRSLLSKAGIELPDEIDELAAAATDDLVDAAAVAWSARRIVRGEALSLPAEPEANDDRQIAIWY
jgi:predicted RNase H-like nuclease